jgi:site-specific DNA-methyltransferase (adenine-specific)
MAPGLVGAEKAARGKTPTDVWWHTIVSPTGKEETGYATQKPLGILERIVWVHSNAGERCWTSLQAAAQPARPRQNMAAEFLLIYESANAINVTNKRHARYLDQ